MDVVAGGFRWIIEVREAGKEPRRVELTGPVEVGRECDGWTISDNAMSRRHLRLRPTDGAVVVEDLGSRNGTRVNDMAVTDAVLARPGDVIQAGATDFVVVGPVAITAPPASSAPSVTTPPASAPSPASAAAPRPALDDLAARSVEGAVIRFRPGTYGERVASSVASSVRRARKRLAGLGSEPWGVPVQVCLVDPFPDPAQPGAVVASGAVIDAARGEIWMAVTAESPPEPPERALAMFFGAALPAAADLEVLLEGYGLSLAGAAPDDEDLAKLDLPPLEQAEGDLRAAMARAFVAFLIDKAGQSAFLSFLATGKPGRVDTAATDVFGADLASLEEAWRDKLTGSGKKPTSRQFLRLGLRYLRPHRRREVEIGLYMLFGLGFVAVYPFVLRRLLDHAIPSGHFSQVATLLAILFGALFISLLATLRQSYLSAVIGGSIVRDVRAQMFERLHQLPASWYDRHPQGDVMTRLFSDVPNLQAALTNVINNGVNQILTVVVSGSVALVLNPLLGLIVIAGAPVVAVIYRTMAKGARSRSLALQEEVAHVMGVAGESVSAQQVVKAFGLQARERLRFGRSQDRWFARSVRLSLFGGLFQVSVNSIVTLIQVVVIGFGAWLILHHQLTIGGLVAFTGVMGQVINPVTSLTSIGQQLQAATGSLARVNEVLDAVPDIADREHAPDLAPLQHQIELHDVHFAYRPERPTLRGVSCVIRSGTRTAFVGPTGAGKSSILGLLNRFYDPSDGAVTFDGTDVRDVTLASMRGQIGVVFQETTLFDTTIRENIAMARPGASDAEVEAAAREAELHDFIVTLPRGYDTRVGERGGRLSGGQKQRLAIARALLRQPRVLLLDEATSALDPRTERLVADTLERVGAGLTTISVTHRLGSVVGYDQIFVVVAGEIAEHGTHQQLLQQGGVYAELWSEQTEGARPAEVAFDVRGALGAIPLFAGLGPDQLDVVASRLRALDLPVGSDVPEGRGQLCIVRRGRPQVRLPSPTGGMVDVAELGPGDAFGLAALLGQESGAVLSATQPVQVLVLDDEAIRALAVLLPTVAAGLAGTRATLAPVGGTRLARSTLRVGVREVASLVGAGPTPGAASTATPAPA